MTNIDRGASASKRKGFFARWFEAMAEARMRHAEHEVHQHIHEDLPAGRDDSDGSRQKGH